MSLRSRILDEIRSKGPMTVARFMELALYDPGHGYYTAGGRRAGSEWLTGPTLHEILGFTLARGIAPLLAQLDEPTLVELGTGSGELTRDICYGLYDHAPDTFSRIDIVLADRSPSARERAAQTLEAAGIGMDDVRILEDPPDAIEGVVVHNELLDAIPVHLCEVREDGVAEIHVVEGEPSLGLQALAPSSATVEQRAEPIAQGLATGTRFELALEAQAYTSRLARSLERGAILSIDYGASRAQLLEAYPHGTLHAYRHGQRVDEFHYDPGQMDITYRVPFDEVQLAGEEGGLDTRLLARQDRVLEALGVRQLARQGTGQDVLAAKKLIDPAGAGGTFHVLLQTRGVDVGAPWPAP